MMYVDRHEALMPVPLVTARTEDRRNLYVNETSIRSICYGIDTIG